MIAQFMRKYFFLISILFISCQPFAQKKNKTSANLTADRTLEINKNISDSALLDLVEKQTFRYFWDFSDPVSGMARERSNRTDYGSEVAATGGTGFGVMSIIVAVNRKWITRDSAVNHLLKLVKFLSKSDKYHGVFPQDRKSTRLNSSHITISYAV